MGVRYDLRDLTEMEAKCRREVYKKFDRVGRNFVRNAKERGSYKDRTGNLRASNKYTASEEHLVMENTAEYASDVEAKGYEVTSGALLMAINELEQ